MRLGDLRAQALSPPGGCVVSEQDSFGSQHLDQRRDDALTHGLEPRRQDLNDQPAVVAIHNERRNGISLAMHQALGGGIDACTSGDAGAQPLDPPAVINGTVGTLQKPQPDL
jgi:hypothetical protein